MTLFPRGRWTAAAGLSLALLTACSAPDPGAGQGGSAAPTGSHESADPSESSDPSESAATPGPEETSSDPDAGGTEEPSSEPTTPEPGTDLTPTPGASPTQGPSAEPSDPPVQGGSTPEATDGPASPVVTYAEVTAGRLTVNAHVGVIEAGGTCTLRATRGSEEITASVDSFADAKTTLCDPFELLLPDGGSWNVELTYSSSQSRGSTTFEVTP